ncbi:hypothetical protein Vafri_16253, partial [Volvox africanus]
AAAAVLVAAALAVLVALVAVAAAAGAVVVAAAAAAPVVVAAAVVAAVAPVVVAVAAVAAYAPARLPRLARILVKVQVEPQLFAVCSLVACLWPCCSRLNRSPSAWLQGPPVPTDEDSARETCMSSA